MKKYKCPTCDYIYDPALGDPEAEIPPGTAFDDLPDDWVCPDCGEPKEEFEAVEEQGVALLVSGETLLIDCHGFV